MKRKLLLSGILAVGMSGFAMADLPTKAGTEIGNEAVGFYHDLKNNEYRTTSNLVKTIVEAVEGVDVVALVPSKEAVPGQTVYFPYVIKNIGNADTTYNVGITSTYPSTIYVDKNKNGLVDPGESQVSSVDVPYGGELPIVVKVAVPETANPGDGDNIVLTANTLSVSDNDTSTLSVINDGVLTINETASKSQARPGEEIAYNTSFKNVGNLSVNAVDGLNIDGNSGKEGVIVYSVIPSGTTYKAGSLSGEPTSGGQLVYSTDGTHWTTTEPSDASTVKYVGIYLPDSNPDDNAKDAVLDPDQAGQITYTVVVNNPFNDTDGVIDNLSIANYSDQTGTDKEVTSNEVRIPVPSSSTADIALGAASPAEEDSGNNWQDDKLLENAPAGNWIESKVYVDNKDSSNEDTVNLIVDENTLPAGSIVEFWDGDSASKLLDTDSDGNPDITVPASGEKEITVRIYIPDTASAVKDGSIDYYVTVKGQSTNNSAENDKTRINIDGVVSGYPDTGKVGKVGDNNNQPANGVIDSEDDIDAGAIDPQEPFTFPFETVNANPSPDTISYSLDLSGLGGEYSIYKDKNCDGSIGNEDKALVSDLLGGTILKENANSGDTTLQVENVEEFEVGDSVVVGAGTANAEKVTITAVDASAKTITVSPSLSANHAAGEIVGEDSCYVAEVKPVAKAPQDYVFTLKAKDSNTGVEDTADVKVTVNAVAAVDLRPDHSGEVAPSGSTIYKHIVKNTSNADGEVKITVPTGMQLNYVILDESMNPQGTQWTVSLPEGTEQTFYVKVLAPSTVPQGQVEAATITAEIDIDGDHNPDAVDSVTDTTKVQSNFVKLTKDKIEIDRGFNNGTCVDAGDGRVPAPCDYIQYTIKYKNIGDNDAINFYIIDDIPDHTEYVSNSMCLDTNCDGTCDTNLSDAADSDKGTFTGDKVRFDIGTVHPDEEGCVMFKVKIK